MTPSSMQKLYLSIAILFACSTLVSVIIFIYLRLRSNRREKAVQLSFRHAAGEILLVSKDVSEVKQKESSEFTVLPEKPCADVESGKGTHHIHCEDGMSSSSDVDSSSAEVKAGWGKWYTWKELETATRGFSDEYIVGKGGHGVVYRGTLPDGSVVAIKNLSNKEQAEKEFIAEVETIGRVRHRNLVGLVGYCTEGDNRYFLLRSLLRACTGKPCRLLVYEYVDNGNLEHWLHANTGSPSTLNWDIRMKIVLGTAKGLAYLHEGLEPKVVHRDVKSSNILLDETWNPKVSDFGLAKLLHADASYVSTRVMGTFGYVSPDYASTGKLNAASDVYSFGVLLIETITGRAPVDYTRPTEEVNLVEWFKEMVASRRVEEILDPRIDSPPSSRELKRALLACLRCLDLDSVKRPKMGQVVHILEGSS